MSQTATSPIEFNEREEHLKRLRELNEKANVDAEVVDLIEAYARLKFRRHTAFDFYPEPSEQVASSHPEVLRLARRNPELDGRTRAFLLDYAHEMRRRRLPVLTSVRHLASELSIGTAELDQMRHGRHNYRIFSIPKRRGGTRRMAEPRAKLKRAQRWIKSRIVDRVGMHRRAHGFRRYRSIVTNARAHVGREIVIRIDLKDFFWSVEGGRVFNVFYTLGFPRAVAEALAGLTTLEDGLPIGAPSSPGLSNIVARRLDVRFHRLGRKEGFTYTRYADDLSFSSNRRHLNKMIPFFKEIIRDEGFEVNEAKILVMRRSNRQMVTGLVVNDKVSVPRETVRQLRAVLYNCRTGHLDVQRRRWAEDLGEDPSSYGIGTFRQSLRGNIEFVRGVDPERGEPLLREFRAIGWPASGV